jgi:hypothetical protein
MFRKTTFVVIFAALFASSFEVVDASIRPLETSKPSLRRNQKLNVNRGKLSFDENFALKKQQATQSAALTVRGGVANTFTNAIAGSVALALIEKAVKKGLAAAKIEFPGQLAACIVLFSSLLLIETVSPSTANGIFNALTPGSALLAKWLPVFFVPGLVLLPLSKSIGGSMEVCLSHHSHGLQ